jgi:serine protease Do
LPSDGRYQIIIGSYNNTGSGAYDLEIEHGNGLSLTPTVIPTPLPPEIASLGTQEGDLPFGQTALWLYNGTAGETLTMSLSSDMFDTFLTIKNAAGDELMLDDDSGEIGTNSRISDFTLPADGEYQIIVGSFGDGGAGHYILEIELVQSMTPSPTATQQ